MRVAVLAGGRSGEHDVSLASAAAVRAGLERAGHEPVVIEISREGSWSSEGVAVTLEPAGGLLRCDVCFPVLHGPYGEDGVVQGMLEVLRVPYVGAGVLASALCMDKVLFKDVMAQHRIPQVDYAAVRPGDDLDAALALGLPLFIKPARLGSSVGISKVASEEELAPAVEAAFAHDDLVIAEAFSDGMEVECSLLGGGRSAESSVLGEIVIEADWYDYDAKYTDGGMELVVPARLPEAVAGRVRSLAAEVFVLVGCTGMARCDFFVEDPEGDARVLVNELNTIPGFTETSVYAKLFEASGVPYERLLERLLTLALDR